MPQISKSVTLRRPRLHSGFGPPPADLGTPYDSYMDGDTGFLWIRDDERVAETAWRNTNASLKGPPGHDGAEGPAGRAVEAQYPTAVRLGPRQFAKLFRGLLYPADPSDEPYSVIGLVREAHEAGDLATTVSAGQVNGFSGLVPDRVYYLGPNGTVLPTPPSGFTPRVAGVAQSADTLLVRQGAPPLVLPVSMPPPPVPVVWGKPPAVSALGFGDAADVTCSLRDGSTALAGEVVVATKKVRANATATVAVAFAAPFARRPVVVVTPTEPDSPAPSYVRSLADGFTLYLTPGPSKGGVFGWAYQVTPLSP